MHIIEEGEEERGAECIMGCSLGLYILTKGCLLRLFFIMNQ